MSRIVNSIFLIHHCSKRDFIYFILSAYCSQINKIKVHVDEMDVRKSDLPYLSIKVQFSVNPRLI